MITKIKYCLNKIEVDRAVFFGILAKIWSAIAGPITALFIIIKFTPELQGYYYTFGTLLALQIFVELGLGTVIIQFASHEWSKLHLDKNGNIKGDNEAFSRLVSLAKVSLKWYLVGGVIVAFGLGLGGYIFFARSPNTNINWEYPWLTLCLLTGINIFLVPMWSLLEGCNQVSKLYTYRFFQGFFTSLSIWIAIVFGAKLWTTSISILVTLVCAGLFVKYKYWIFFRSLLLHKVDKTFYIGWYREIFPMQWRIALSCISGYFVFSFFIPFLFKLNGPVVAGQMGLTWNMITFVGLVATSWLAPKVPKFGILIAQKKYAELDSLFWKLGKILFLVSVFFSFFIWAIIYGINQYGFKIAERFIKPLPLFLFLLAQIFQVISLPFSSYLRAHKREPLLFTSLLQGILTVIVVFTLGKRYSVNGIAVGFLLVNLILVPFVFIIWKCCKVSWHQIV